VEGSECGGRGGREGWYLGSASVVVGQALPPRAKLMRQEHHLLELVQFAHGYVALLLPFLDPLVELGGRVKVHVVEPLARQRDVGLHRLRHLSASGVELPLHQHAAGRVVVRSRVHLLREAQRVAAVQPRPHPACARVEAATRVHLRCGERGEQRRRAAGVRAGVEQQLDAQQLHGKHTPSRPG
jgi:hypothetical protein